MEREERREEEIYQGLLTLMCGVGATKVDRLGGRDDRWGESAGKASEHTVDKALKRHGTLASLLKRGPNSPAPGSRGEKRGTSPQAPFLPLRASGREVNGGQANGPINGSMPQKKPGWQGDITAAQPNTEPRRSKPKPSGHSPQGTGRAVRRHKGNAGGASNRFSSSPGLGAHAWDKRATREG